MDDFLRFFNKKRETFPMHLNIFYSKAMDWNIIIYKIGCFDEYPDAERDETGNVIIARIESCCDMELAFAEAQVKLKDWLSEYEGGY